MHQKFKGVHYRELEFVFANFPLYSQSKLSPRNAVNQSICSDSILSLSVHLIYLAASPGSRLDPSKTLIRPYYIDGR